MSEKENEVWKDENTDVMMGMKMKKCQKQQRKGKREAEEHQSVEDGLMSEWKDKICWESANRH